MFTPNKANLAILNENKRILNPSHLLIKFPNKIIRIRKVLHWQEKIKKVNFSECDLLEIQQRQQQHSNNNNNNNNKSRDRQIISRNNIENCQLWILTTRAIFMWQVLFICQWTLRQHEHFLFENKRLKTGNYGWKLATLCVVSSTRTIFCMWQFLFAS